MSVWRTAEMWSFSRSSDEFQSEILWQQSVRSLLQHKLKVINKKVSGRVSAVAAAARQAHHISTQHSHGRSEVNILTTDRAISSCLRSRTHFASEQGFPPEELTTLVSVPPPLRNQGRKHRPFRVHLLNALTIGSSTLWPLWFNRVALTYYSCQWWSAAEYWVSVNVKFVQELKSHWTLNLHGGSTSYCLLTLHTVYLKIVWPVCIMKNISFWILSALTDWSSAD